MMKPTRVRVYPTVGIILLLVFSMGAGCGESKPLTPKADTFRKEIQAALKRLAPPLAKPVAQEDHKGVQKVLVRLFALCAKACEGLMDDVVVLDKDGISIAVYPPRRCRMWEYADYAAIKNAMLWKKPTNAVLYTQDGSTIYVICAPLLIEDKVSGILCLGFAGKKVKEKRGISREEFLSLTIQNPD